ncbi:hypothetical protein A5M85_07300 [Cellulophaga lytica]|uniref:O-antigen ligase family protein n=1 Tax=Cellulophaga lytica TaxID=979 RepID=UPI000950A22F|nr:O-antigen ligase family protein [Cellulophaga lytica]APU10095.1 hypothetical protein A5M85_07300 [Cellulophaga lytica]
MIFFSLSVLLFQSKVSIVILLSLLFVYWVHFIRNRNWKQRIVSIVIAIMVCIVSITIVKKRFDTMMRRLNNLDLIEGKGSTIERIQYYNSAKKLIQEKPFLGYGIGDVKDVMMIQINKLGYLNLIEKNQGDPHNEFLKVFLASGVIGLLFFIYLFYILFKYALKKKNYFMLGIFWIFFCNCLVESYLSRQAGIIPFLIFSCILLKLSTKNIEN